MRDLLVVVDMQNDFISGSLGTSEAQAIVENVKRKIAEYAAQNKRIIFTQDTHKEDYLETREGKYLPVKHCINGTWGWEIPEDIDIPTANHYKKDRFAYDKWIFDDFTFEDDGITSIEVIGLCTDICVISNVFALQMEFPELDFTVDASCCAGTTPEKHKAALEVMKSCQIEVINE